MTPNLLTLPIGPDTPDPATNSITRTWGPLTVYTFGIGGTVPWLAVALVNGTFRIGQLRSPISSIRTMRRFSVALWDHHHKRWANQRVLHRDRLLGLVKADDPGLDELGIDRWVEPVKSKLIVVGR